MRVSFATSNAVADTVEIVLGFSVVATESCTTELQPESPRLYDQNGEDVPATVIGAVCDVQVHKPMSSLDITPKEMNLCVGDSESLYPVTVPFDATILSSEWISYNTDVVTVDQNGVVTATGEGSTEIEYRVEGAGGMLHVAYCSVRVYAKPTVSVGSLYVSSNEMITIPVCLDAGGNYFSAGSLNLTYNTELLELISAESGDMLDATMVAVNPTYRDGTVRLSFVAGQHVVTGYGEICLLNFRTLGEGTAIIQAQDVRLFNESDVLLEPFVENGQVTSPSGKLALSDGQFTAWTSFDVTLRYEGTIPVAGGSIVIEYDSEKLSLLNCSVEMGGTSSVNLMYAENAAKISFACVEGVADSSLLTLRFMSIDNNEEEVAAQIVVKADQSALYDYAGVQIIPRTEPATVKIAHNANPPAVGDVGQDGKIDTRDSFLLLQFLMGNISQLNTHQADIDRNGIVDHDDLVLLMKYLAEWNITLPQ
jgi:hypothetical protein